MHWSVWSLLLSLCFGCCSPALTVLMLSCMPGPVAFVVRCVISYLALLVSAVFGVVVSVLLRAFGDVRVAQWATARCFRWCMWQYAGVTFAVDDTRGLLASTRPAVFVGNHQTELDVLMLGCVFPKYCSVAAKSSLRRVPFLGWYMSLSGTVFIDRNNSRDAREAMRAAASEMCRRRQSVFMFPEGTRSYAREPALLPFKKGAFHLAVQAQVPIVPVVVANYSHVLSARNMVFRPAEIPVKVLDPIPTTGFTAADVERLTEQTRTAMFMELLLLTARERGSSTAMPADKNSMSKAGNEQAGLPA